MQLATYFEDAGGQRNALAGWRVEIHGDRARPYAIYYDGDGNRYRSMSEVVRSFDLEVPAVSSARSKSTCSAGAALIAAAERDRAAASSSAATASFVAATPAAATSGTQEPSPAGRRSSRGHEVAAGSGVQEPLPVRRRSSRNQNPYMEVN